MHPAPRYGQVFQFLLHCMVDLIPIRNTDTGVILQEFPRVGCIPCLLIFVEDNLFILIQMTRTVDPHIAFGACRPPVTVYQNRSLICLDDMIIIQFPVKIIIQYSQVFLSQTNHPVCHVLSGDCKTIPFKLLLQTIKRNSIYILSIYDGSRKAGRHRTSMQQPSGMVSFYHVSVCFAGIYTDVMFIHLHAGRNETVSS